MDFQVFGTLVIDDLVIDITSGRVIDNRGNVFKYIPKELIDQLKVLVSDIIYKR